MPFPVLRSAKRRKHADREPSAVRALGDRLGRLLLRRPLLVALIVIPAALALGSLAGFAAGKAGTPKRSPHDYVRAQTVAAHLRQLDGDYLLAAGDSHIEYWFSGSLCGLPVVNAGLAGATVQSYADFFAALPLTPPPRAIILTIGTNNAHHKRVGQIDEAAGSFRAGLGRLLGQMRQRSALVVLTAVPPLAPAAMATSREAVARFNGVAQAACQSGACRFADPFAGGVSFVDEVHLDDYAGLYAALGPALCADLAATTAAKAETASPMP